MRLVYLAAALAAVYLVLPVRAGVAVGHSMEPTLRNGQVYLFRNGAGGGQAVRRGDVVVFDHQGRTYVKRVLGVGGDVLQVVRSGSLDEDELILSQHLSRIERLVHRFPWSQRLTLHERRVPEGACYVVGDNLASSVDSRQFGPIPVEAIRGVLLSSPPCPRGPDRFAVGLRSRRRS